MNEQIIDSKTRLAQLGIILLVVSFVTAPALMFGPALVSAEEAGTTSVRLDSDKTTVKQGGVTRFDIVVSSANGGVGAADGEISLSNSDVAEITDVSMASSAELTDVTISDDGDAVSFRGALMDTQNSGSVTIGTVLIRGKQTGDTNILLSMDVLSDESGNPYQIGVTPDRSISVTRSQSSVDLNLQADSQTVEVGSSVEFEVTRADTSAPVRANVSIAGNDYSTGVTGSTNVEITEEMISDAGTVSAVARKRPTADETFQSDYLTLDAGSSTDAQQPSSPQPTDPQQPSSPQPSKANGTTIAIEPTESTIESNGQQQFRLVAHNVDDGVGAVTATAMVQSTEVAKITDVTPVGSPGIEDTSVDSTGKSASLQLALMDADRTAPVEIAEITVEATGNGQTVITPNVSALGTSNGSSYKVDSTISATVAVGDSNGGQPSPSGETTVLVDLNSMPNGFNKANVTVTAPPETTIIDFEPRLVTATQFRVADGGIGQNSITVQSVDLGGNVGPTNQKRPMFALTFDSRPNLDDISVEVTELQNDDRNHVSGERVSLSFGASDIFDSPLPGAGVENQPSDPDGDGLYEDINGDDVVNFDDAVALSFVSNDRLSEEEVSAIDFDSDGDIDNDDAISLAFQQ